MKRTTSVTKDLATRRRNLEGDPPFKGPGPPSTYRSWMKDEVIELGKQGKDRTQIAGALGVSKVTLYGWMRTFPEFFEAMELAWTHMYEVHLQQLEDLITGSDNINKGAVAALIFKLKNTVGFADRIEERVRIEEEVRLKVPTEQLVLDLPQEQVDLLQDLCTDCARRVLDKHSRRIPWDGNYQNKKIRPKMNISRTKIIDVEPGGTPIKEEPITAPIEEKPEPDGETEPEEEIQERWLVEKEEIEEIVEQPRRRGRRGPPDDFGRSRDGITGTLD